MRSLHCVQGFTKHMGLLWLDSGYFIFRHLHLILSSLLNSLGASTQSIVHTLVPLILVFMLNFSSLVWVNPFWGKE
jgi:hypothetical protein